VGQASAAFGCTRGRILGLVLIASALAAVGVGWLRYSAAKYDFVSGAFAGDLNKAQSTWDSAKIEWYITLGVGVAFALIGACVLRLKSAKCHARV
jgi:hypothetical protein